MISIGANRSWLPPIYRLLRPNSSAILLSRRAVGCVGKIVLKMSWFLLHLWKQMTCVFLPHAYITYQSNYALLRRYLRIPADSMLLLYLPQKVSYCSYVRMSVATMRLIKLLGMVSCMEHFPTLGTS